MQQFDPARPFPGGIDTCLRGIVRYLPPGAQFAFVGVDAGGDVPGRRLGQWEVHNRGGGNIYFLPVARFDPGDQKRKLPHSVRLVLGTIRYRNRLPRSEWFQAHRVDTAWSLRRILGKRTAYFVHTQEDGLTGQTSDSFWRAAPGIHKRLERGVVKDAAQVVVFNEAYADVVREWNPQTQASPTWFDPDLIKPADPPDRDKHSLIWVGRLEVPKDPLLAVSAFRALAEADTDIPWRLNILGSGTLERELQDYVARLPLEIGKRVTLHGRTAPSRVGELMASSGVFVMTSHAGYEGYPRVLVEALASGLPAVVTDGSDTGALVANSQNGFVTTRDPEEIAQKVREAVGLRREAARTSVSHLSAPAVINAIYASGDR